VGLPNRMRRLAELDKRYHLAVSLHAPNDELRQRIVPTSDKIGLRAILDAATYFQERTGRQVTYEYVLLRDVNDGPDHAAEARDLANAVVRAMGAVLTPHQRRVAVALLVDGVPIDVLADRLGTTRGALYKTVHDVRGRLRAELVATGHLATPPSSTSAGTP